MKENRRQRQLSKMIWFGVLLGLVFGVMLCTSGWQRTAGDNIVRAVLLEEEDGIYCVGVLYQDPEAAANSADAQVQLSLVYAEGESLATAFQALEQSAEKDFSYQMSDYLLLCNQCSKEVVDSYAAELQTTQRGRYAAQVSYLAQGIADVAEVLALHPEGGQTLLEALEHNTDVAPYLYETAQENAQKSLVMPLLLLAEDSTVAPLEQMYLLSTEGAQVYDKTQTQLYLLLRYADVSAAFFTGTHAFAVAGRILSWEGSLTGVSSSFSETFGTISVRVNEVADDIGDAEKMEVQAEEEALPTLLLYGVVRDVSDDSATAILEMEQYLEELTRQEPEVLAQLGIGAVEVCLISLSA